MSCYFTLFMFDTSNWLSLVYSTLHISRYPTRICEQPEKRWRHARVNEVTRYLWLYHDKWVVATLAEVDMIFAGLKCANNCVAIVKRRNACISGCTHSPSLLIKNGRNVQLAKGRSWNRTASDRWNSGCQGRSGSTSKRLNGLEYRYRLALLEGFGGW